MAIWQWDLWIVPRKEVERQFPIVPQYMDLDWFESIEWWNDVSENGLKSFFDKVLPNYHAPWAKDTQSWGSDDGDRVEVTIENGKITGIWTQGPNSFPLAFARTTESELVK